MHRIPEPDPLHCIYSVLCNIGRADVGTARVREDDAGEGDGERGERSLPGHERTRVYRNDRRAGRLARTQPLRRGKPIQMSSLPGTVLIHVFIIRIRKDPH
jgi:hypothetical protein